MWILQLALAFGLLLLQALLAPKPKGPEPGSLDDLDLPKVKEGDEIPIVFGSPWVNSPQAPWLADKSFEKLVKKTSAFFGLITNKQTLGFKYFAGIHFVLCEGPVDKLLRISIAEKDAYTGDASSGTLTLDKPKLFGDEEREGGVSGFVDIEQGDGAQTANAYLAAQQAVELPGGHPGISAYRGVFGLVFRGGGTSGGFQLGNSNFPPKFAFQVQNILAHPEQWQPLTAPIPGGDATVADEGTHTEGTKTTFSAHGLGFPAHDFEANFSYGVDLSGELLYTIDLRDNSSTSAAVDWTGQSMVSSVPSSCSIEPLNGDIWVSYQIFPPVNNFRLKLLDKDGTLQSGHVQFFGAGGDPGRHVGFYVGNTRMVFTDIGASGNNVYTYIAGVFAAVTGGTTIPDDVADGPFIVSGATEATAWSIDSGGTIRAFTITASSVTTAWTSSSGQTGLVYSAEHDILVLADGTELVGYDMASFAFTELWRVTAAFTPFQLSAHSQNKITNRFGIHQGSVGTQFAIYDIRTGGLQWTDGIHQWGSSSVRVVFDDDSGSFLGNYTALGGVPVTRVFGPAGTGPADWLDMNPAHILRRVIYSSANGGIESAAIFGTTWKTAADTLFNERLGLSVLLTNPGDKASFIRTIEDHADCLVYQDRSSGLWEIKLIRNDYDVGTLTTIDDSVAIEWSDISWPAPTELTNQIVVTYTDLEKNGEAATAPVTNVAHVASVGKVIQDKVDYPGFSHNGTADRKAQSVALARSTPLVSGTVKVRYLSPTLNRGDAIIVNSTRFELNNIVARITEIIDGDGRNNEVIVRFVQDKFDTPTQVFSSPETTVPFDTSAQDATDRIIEEAPYEFLTSINGKPSADDLLTTTPGAGVAYAAIKKPNNFHKSFDLHADPGGGYENKGLQDFTLSAVLQTALTHRADNSLTFDIATNAALDDLTVPGVVVIGSEMMRLDGIVTAGATMTVTVGRGIFDTVPVTHSIGAVAFFIDVPQFAQEQYDDADDVDFKPLTSTTDDTLTEAEATATNIVFDSRAIRPYPPGKFQLDGDYVNDTVVSAPQLTWVDRDRLDQALTTTAEDHHDGDIGPEAGTTYQVRVYAMNSAGADISTLINTNVGTAKLYNYPGAALPAGTVRLRGQVWSVRDTYESFQAPSLTWIPPVTADSGAVTADTDQITTDNG